MTTLSLRRRVWTLKTSKPLNQASANRTKELRVWWSLQTWAPSSWNISSYDAMMTAFRFCLLDIFNEYLPSNAIKFIRTDLYFFQLLLFCAELNLDIPLILIGIHACSQISCISLWIVWMGEAEWNQGMKCWANWKVKSQKPSFLGFYFRLIQVIRIIINKEGCRKLPKLFVRNVGACLHLRVASTHVQSTVLSWFQDFNLRLRSSLLNELLSPSITTSCLGLTVLSSSKTEKREKGSKPNSTN